MGGIIYKFLDCGREAGVPRGSPHGPEENMQAPHGEAPAGIRTWDLHDVGLLCYLFIHLFIYPEINVFFQREMQLSTGTMDNRATRNSNTTQKTSQDKKRKMLIFCLLLLISSQHIGAEAEYCTKKLPCSATTCFEIRGRTDPVCNSTQQTETCSINGNHIKLKSDVQLRCSCMKNFSCELDCKGTPECSEIDQNSDLSTSEVPERNNTNRTESSGSSMTPLQIAAAAAVPALVALLVFGAITCYVWKAIRKQGPAGGSRGKASY